MRGLLVDPVVIVLVLLAGGIALGRHRPGRILVVIATLTLYLLATPWLSARLLRLAESPAGASPTELSPQAIVVLSAGRYPEAPEYGGETVDALTLERLRYAARLQRQTGLPILVSGGRSRHSGRSLAELMGQALTEDFHASVRWMEDRSKTTYENARYSADILRADGIGTVYLVTHAAHLPRAWRTFEQAGIAVAPAPTVFSYVNPEFALRDLIPQTSALADSFYALHELAGRLWYRLAHTNVITAGF